VSVIETKSEPAAIGEVVDRLAHEHPTVPPLAVADIVDQMHAKFEGCPVRDFVPLLVERNAKAKLTKLGG
jgi:hypothetical protein